MSSAGLHAEITRGWSADSMKRFPAERFLFLPGTGSTNDDLLERLRRGEGAHLDLIQADHQTKGRGRRGDRWEAPTGSNLLFSIALRLPRERAIWTRLPHLAAWIVGTAVESILPGAQTIQAKWPNDLLIEGRKLAGILVETVLAPEPFAVVGIGLNVNMRRSDLPAELQDIATSIYECLGCESSRPFLLGQIVQGFLRSYPEGLSHFEEVREWLDQRSFLRGRRLRVLTGGGELEGIGGGLGKDGELLLEGANGDLATIISAERILLC